MSLIACIDVGSTFTKGLLVSDEGELLANADHRTTVETDVLEGLDAVLARLAQAGPIDEVRVCSSAGGGLRLAVVGHERVISAEAGYRVGLTSGARVVHVASGQLTDHDIDALVDSRPDIVLLVGGTDGGDEHYGIGDGHDDGGIGLTCHLTSFNRVLMGTVLERLLVYRHLRILWNE